MSDGILQSIKYSSKLVDTMGSLLGPTAAEMAEKITTKEERQKWQVITSKEDAVSMYIKNMKFTVTYLETLKQSYGDRVAEIASELIAQDEQIRWCHATEQTDDHSIENFIRLVWEPLRPIGFEFTLEKRDEGTQLHCSRCPIHELSKMIGGADWLAILECNKDLHNIKAFNPNIGFKRTKTLMKGDSHCDHYYFNKDESHP